MALTKITSSVIGDEFTSSSALSAGATENVDQTSAQIFTLTSTSVSFELIYSDATNGWVIIGQ